MRNRKTLLHSTICLTALSAMVACTSYLDEVQGNSTSMDSAIEVNAMIGNAAGAQTRALPTSSEVTTATLTKFWLSAFKYASSDTVKGTTDDQQKTALTLFDKQFDRTDGIYSDGGIYYWTVGDIQFCAVAATDGAGIAHPKGTDTIKVAKDKITAENFKVDSTGSLTTFQNQEDYVVAVNRTSKPSGSNKIDLTFQHILSRISINAYAPGFKTNRPYLSNFAFDSVQVKGSFEFTGSKTDSTFYYKDGTSGDKCWTCSATDTATVGSKADVWYENNVFKLDTVTTNKRLATGTNIVPWLNVIPCGTIARNLYLVLWYQDKSWSYTLDLSKITALTEYKPGYQYIYNVYVTGNDDPEGEKVRPQVELVNVVVQEWSSSATTQTIETADAASGNTLKKQIEADQAAGKQNLVVKLSSSVITEVTMRDSVILTTNVELDLNDHTLIPAAKRANGDTTAAFYVTGGHRFAIKGTGTVKVDTVSFTKLNGLVQLKSGESNSFAIRGGTWSFDPQKFVPGYSEYQSYPEIVSPETSSSISITGPSHKYTVTKQDLETSPKTYSYTVTED